MVYYEKKGKRLSMLSAIDSETEERVQREADAYQLVKSRTITWERLDDDRSGSDIDVFYYPLTGEGTYPNFCMIIENGHFAGIRLHYTNTTSWNAGLDKEESLSGVDLYVDGRVNGSATSKSSYDSPNNYDEVRITYKIAKRN